ncbi:hypothetical protein EON66_08030, partial [archaeon]
MVPFSACGREMPWREMLGGAYFHLAHHSCRLRVRAQPLPHTHSRSCERAESVDDEDEILRKAIAASLVDHDGQQPPAYREASSEHDEELAAALKASMANEGHKDKRAKRQGHSTDSEWDTNSSEGDDEFRLAVKASQDQHSQHQQRDDDAELQRAISQSQEAHKEATSADEEERVVMEYVKKQSLLEEEHRRTANKGKGK